MSVMPRAATTSDPFNAIAEPQRRRILTVLKGHESPVNDLASALRITPSLASKHLPYGLFHQYCEIAMKFLFGARLE